MSTPQSVRERSVTKPGMQEPRPIDMVLAQIVAYCVLILTAMVSSSRDANAAVNVPIAAVGVVLVLLAFLVCSPLRDGLPGRIIAGLCGVGSLVFAVIPGIGDVMFSKASSGLESASSIGYYPQEVWAAGVCGLLIVLIIASFARQMVREERSHLIRSLSHGVTGGVAVIAVSGWCFLPDLIEAIQNAESGLAVTATWVSGIVIVALVMLLAICSRLWSKDANPPENALHPWAGIGLIPPMLLGPVIAVASFAVGAL